MDTVPIDTVHDVRHYLPDVLYPFLCHLHYLSLIPF